MDEESTVIVGITSPCPSLTKLRTNFTAVIGLAIVRLVPAIVLAALSPAQTSSRADDFSITLERGGCLGTCPDYKVMILGNGSVQYKGLAYVRIDGIRRKTIPVSAVQKLVQRLRDEDFFHWEEKKQVCVDFPEVDITVTLMGQRKRVLEGCNSPGRVLALADEIDRISGAKRWIGKVR